MSVEAHLPSSVNFADPLKYLPDQIESVLMSVQPNGGSASFQNNTRIEVNLPSRPGLYIDPKSIHIRYNLRIVPSATANISVIGCPAYAPFSTLTERVNSMNIATLNQYNVVAHRWIKSNLNVADQYGQQASLGYSAPSNAGINDGPTDLDGWYQAGVTTSGVVIPLSAPLICSAIANCDHLIPTALLGQVQFDFTTDAVANYAITSTGTITTTIQNFEVCFLAVDMGAQTDAMVASMGEKIYLKTNAWASNGQPLSNSAGQQTLNYVMRYASVESALLGFYKSDSPNLAFDAVDVTNGNGSYQYQLANKSYPQTPFNTFTNKVGVLQELRRCFGSIADWRHSPAISTTEFNSVVATVTTLDQPGSFYVPYCFSKIKSFNPYQEVSLLSGVTTANTGINVIVNSSSAPGASTTGLLAVNYSMLIAIDTATRTFNLIQ
jgi:hypothetical protein